MTMKKILFVCTGNTCRSPMAAYLLRDLLQKEGMAADVLIESAGLAAEPGDPISENAALALRERGISAEGHRAKQLTLPLVEQADLIYVMTEAHRQAIIRAVPAADEKIRVLQVPDPYGMDLYAYRECLKKLEDVLKKQLPDILSGKDKGQDK